MNRKREADLWRTTITVNVAVNVISAILIAVFSRLNPFLVAGGAIVAIVILAFWRRPSPGERKTHLIRWILPFFSLAVAVSAVMYYVPRHLTICIAQPAHAGAGGENSPVEDIAGKVEGFGISLVYKQYRVIVYARAAMPAGENSWFVQSIAGSSQLTEIHSDGTWNTQTRLGSNYAALLVTDVTNGCSPPATLGVLPGPGLNLSNSGLRVVAITVTNGIPK